MSNFYETLEVNYERLKTDYMEEYPDENIDQVRDIAELIILLIPLLKSHKKPFINDLKTKVISYILDH